MINYTPRRCNVHENNPLRILDLFFFHEESDFVVICFRYVRLNRKMQRHPNGSDSILEKRKKRSRFLS